MGIYSPQGHTAPLLSQFNVFVVYVQDKSQTFSDILTRTPWVYPTAHNADANFHGSQGALGSATDCDRKDDLLDGFGEILHLFRGLVQTQFTDSHVQRSIYYQYNYDWADICSAL